ncbi:phosphonate ABC transporter, permease protein PhnE [Tomitella gaofuii]|uniref:phosphonate ABC transporter, permease protein PhnE n=1 Tax=Tomitella gaofuii TaxID=2760083 RepID=UPI0030B7FAF6
MHTLARPAPQPAGEASRAGVVRPRRLESAAAKAVLVALVAAGIWSTMALQINVASIADSAGNAVDFAGRMLPLDFPPVAELAGMIGETLAIVLLATVLSVVLSIPVAVAAAESTGRTRLGRSGARGFIVLMRAIPDLILAIVFFRVFGLGALPGILAMGLHSIGMVGKLLADAIEDLDPGPRAAVQAAGGGRVQQVVVGVLPQLLPQIIATGLHRFDINLRTSVLLGYVGVGGIGLAIAESMRTLDYRRGMALALTVLVLCILTELVSGAFRRRLLGTPRSRAPRGRSVGGGALVGWADRVSGGWVTGGRRQDRPGGADGRRLSQPWDADRVRRYLWGAVVVALVFLAWRDAGVSVPGFLTGLAELPSTALLFFPPDLSAVASTLWPELLTTLQIALAATFLGAVLAVPIGLLAARNVAPSPAVHGTFRVLIVLVRGVPELILAIVFVVVTGLGAVAGTLALAIGAVGLLSKLVADSLEETDVAVQEALRANGAGRMQVFAAATLRQATPALVAHVLYLLDTNVRAATLLGVVGAGGIGYYLLNASRIVDFATVTTIVLMILGVVLVIEGLAVWLRRALR